MSTKKLVTKNKYKEISKQLASRIFKQDETKISINEYCRILDEEYEVIPFKSGNSEVDRIVNKYCNTNTENENIIVYYGSIDYEEFGNKFIFNDEYKNIYYGAYSSCCSNDRLMIIVSYCEGDFIVKHFKDKDLYNSEVEDVIKWYKENM